MKLYLNKQQHKNDKNVEKSDGLLCSLTAVLKERNENLFDDFSNN